MPFIDDIHYSGDGLKIIVRFNPDRGESYKISFADVKGFRVLEEDDINEFFEPTHSIGWFFEVKDEGWFSLEKIRKSFLTGYDEYYNGEKEYLMMSASFCVNIISRFKPEIIQL
jgi:hypothetical protein